MKCEVEGCKATRFYEGGSMSTAMCVERYVENGQRHYHDPNSHSTRWTCSEGHDFCTSHPTLCPVKGCDWNTRSGPLMDPGTANAKALYKQPV